MPHINAVHVCVKALLVPAIVVGFANSWLSTAYAEPPMPKVSGIVSDSSGAPVVDAEVTLTTEGKLTSYNARTSTSGEFSFQVPVGGYVMRISASGFETTTITVSPASFNKTPVAVVLQVARQS